MPIYYESRLARVELEQEKLPEIDAAVDALFDDETLSEQEKAKSNWSSVERLVGAPPRLEKVAQDIVSHFEDRLEAIAGKGMIVCMSRSICVDMYSRLVELRPEWHSEDDKQGVVKVVMTGSASDPLEWQQHTLDRVFQSDQVATRDMKIEMENSAADGVVPMIGNPLKFSETPVSYRRAPPCSGNIRMRY